MSKPITLYSAAAGLNTRLEPERLLAGTKDNPGMVELSQAVNVSIDDRGLVSRREGFSLLDEGSFHSLFQDKGDCFVVEEGADSASILRITALSPALAAETIVTDLVKGRRVEFKQINTDTFWSNGVNMGYIRGGVLRSEWPVGSYSGPDVDAEFAPAVPVPHHMAFRRGGQCILGVGNVAFLNHAPFQYGLFSLSKGIIMFGSPITMIADTREGFFVSDSEQTWFFRNTGAWYGYKQELADQSPVKEWSLAHNRVLLRDIGVDAQGEGHVWCSAEGLCVGMDNGTVANLTKDQVAYAPSAPHAATLIKGTVATSSVF